MYHHPFTYQIIYSNRKTLAIHVTAQGEVVVRAPLRMTRNDIERFLTEKESWILKHLQNAAKSPIQAPAPLADDVRRHYIRIARDIFAQKTAYYAALMGVSYGRISIREQKTRWGSCSSEGNLNFNWRLIFAPEEVLDYVVVHELAHRLEMNHSKAFYSIVAGILPDYKKPQKRLKENGNKLWQQG